MGKKFKARPHYRYNHKTLKYEKVIKTWTYYLKRGLSIMSLSVIFGVGFFLLFNFTILSPNEKRLQKENDKISIQYKLLSHQLDESLSVLQNIQERDDNFYRVILQADSIPSCLRQGNYQNTNRYAQWKNFRAGDVVKNTSLKTDELQRMLYTQSNSFDELVTLAKQDKDRLLHLPAIQPLLNKDLKRTSAGYGPRIDPIYGTMRFHHGIDFAAPTGTEIFATGNGKITKIKYTRGYGNLIEIDHGYKYKTRYAHMSKFKKGLRRGQRVKRGDVIGYVGNTGKSTGPHLHYEVRYKGKAINPINFFFLDLSPEKYDEMILVSSNNAKMLD